MLKGPLSRRPNAVEDDRGGSVAAEATIGRGVHRGVLHAKDLAVSLRPIRAKDGYRKARLRAATRRFVNLSH
jgi:hypothetical protein